MAMHAPQRINNRRQLSGVAQMNLTIGWLVRLNAWLYKRSNERTQKRSVTGGPG